MSTFDRLSEAIRQGAAEAFGFDADLAAAAALEDRFEEATADARLLARKVEDFGWDLLNTTARPGYVYEDRNTQRAEIEENYKYYFGDPIVGRTVDLVTYYTFGKGVPKPTYREDDDPDRTAEDLGQSYIDRFWFDYDNQRCITHHLAQIEKSTELQLQANIFFLLVRSDERANESSLGGLTDSPFNQRPSTLKLADLPDNEIVDIIPHPGNKSVPVYYKRVYSPRTYNFDTDAWETSEVPETVYYRDWRNQAPTTWQGRPWGPPASKVSDEGVVYHLAINKNSKMKFGVPFARRYLKWAKGFNQYMTARIATVQAIARMMMVAKVRGGPKHVDQVSSQLQEIGKLAEQVEGAMTRVPAADRQTKVPVANQGVDFQPAVTDTGSASAATDASIFKGQIAAGSGVPVTHLGSDATQTLQGATALDAPLLKFIQALQEIWETVIRDLTGYMLDGVGLDASRVEIRMPDILEKDVNTLNSTLSGMLTTVDPNIGNRELIRFYVKQVLEAMGFTNSNDLIDKFFPPEWETPQEQGQAAAEAEAQAQQAMEAANIAADAANANADTANNAEIEATYNRRTYSTRLGPLDSGAVSRQRAQERYARAQEALQESGVADEAPVAENRSAHGLEAQIEEALSEVDALLTDGHPL